MSLSGALGRLPTLQPLVSFMVKAVPRSKRAEQ